MNLPIGWELKELKEHPGRVYYYNKVTHDSTWVRPIKYPGDQDSYNSYIPLISVMCILISYVDSPKDMNAKNRSRNLTKDEAKKKIDFIFSEIIKGKKFEELARDESDFIPNYRNWNIGWISRGTLGPKFEEVAWNLGIGELSCPVETDYGWQIILRNG